LRNLDSRIGRALGFNPVPHGPEPRSARFGACRWRPRGAPSRGAPLSLLGADSSPIYTADMMKRTMQEATFLILTALAAGSQHGYGIISDVAKISDGRVRLRAGTLYSALDRLRLDGLINVDREEIVENRLRRYYRLTPEGFKQLATEAARFQSNAATAIARLGLAGRMAR
jgi:DNA-binding PadR family transcriptional regulator